MSHSCLGLLEQRRNRPNEVAVGSGKEWGKATLKAKGMGGQQSVTTAVAAASRDPRFAFFDPVDRGVGCYPLSGRQLRVFWRAAGVPL
jgi:hypothetical protein